MNPINTQYKVVITSNLSFDHINHIYYPTLSEIHSVRQMIEGYLRFSLKTKDIISVNGIQLRQEELDEDIQKVFINSEDSNFVYIYRPDSDESDEISELLNAYINNKCEVEGVRDVLRDLVSLGGTRELLLKMHFDKNDIDIVFEEGDGYYDG